MSSPLLNLASTIECPQCSKQSIVSYQSGLYHCLNCDFERDLTSESPASEEGGVGKLPFAMVGFLVAAALIL
jgi:ribosomal protein L37AE/L43A